MIDVSENRAKGFAGHVHLVEIGDISQLSGSTSPTAPLYDEYDVSPVCPVCGNKMRPNDVKDGTLYRYKNSLNAIRHFEFRCKHCGSLYHTDPFIYSIESTNAIYALSSADKTNFFKSEGEMDKYIKPGFGKFSLDSDPLWPIFVAPILIIFALALFKAVLLHYGGSIHIGPLEITTKLLIVLVCICAAIPACHFFISKLRNGREYNLPRK